LLVNELSLLKIKSHHGSTSGGETRVNLSDNFASFE